MSETALPALHAMLDDMAAGGALIDCAAGLAHLLQRPLALVYVENTLALHAAALPQTQALAHAGAAWAPFAPEDVERGWRAQAARLRNLAGTITLRHAVPWSLRTVRGSWPGAALELVQQTDLLFVGTQRVAPRPARTVLLLDDGSAAAARGRQVATELARSLHARLEVLPWPDGDEAALSQQAGTAATCVLPREHATAARLRQPPCTLLLVS
jgi:hypothetical protein